jgi:glutamate-ammonia-ligase adenylyltransferase
MLHRTIKPVRRLSASALRRSAYPIQAWRQQISVAFALPSLPPDPETSAVAAALEIVKADNVRRVGSLLGSLLAGDVTSLAAARGLSDEAERCVREALALSLASMCRRHGPAPGVCAVLALGKMGGRELSFGSDLDLMLVFERHGGDYCPHTAAYFEEVARGLVGALSNPPEMTALYDVDMRLRPHGADGVLAVEGQAFADYYRETCWIWELQALTRARAMAGDEALGRRILGVARAAISRRLGLTAAAALEEVKLMRDLLDEEHPAACPWDVKRAAGGLIDIEFTAQGLQLASGGTDACTPNASTPKALARLAATGMIDPRHAARLTAAWSLQFGILQHQRALDVAPTALPKLPRTRLSALLSETGARTVGQLGQKLATAQTATRALFVRLIGRQPTALAA